jgi:type II secretory pathway component GspD/PulD (secretin)
VPRTNRLIVIATPFEMARIELLVQELDAPSDSRRFLAIPLRYVSVLGVLEPLRNSLLSGSKADEGNAGGLGAGLGAGGVSGALRPQLTGGLNTAGGSSGFGNSTTGGGLGTGSGSSFGGGGGGGSSFGSGAGGMNNQSPVSVIVGKTLLIADPVSNELFVSGPPDHLDTLAELVAQLDRKPRQVMIETVIGQLTLGNDLQHGVDWLRTLQTTGSGDSAVAGSFRFRDGGIPPVRGLSQFSNLATAASSGLSIYGLIGDHLSSYLSLLETSNRFKVLSKPTVFTMNNVPAAISSGQRIAVPSTTLTQVNQVPGNNAAVSATVQFEEVVLEIEVLPLINSEDELTLQIRQQNEDVSGTTNIGGNEVPNITTQELITTVVVPNRSSVLLGGLITERDRDSKTGLPLLNRVPVARHLAGNTRNRTDRSELLIFIQPTIVERPQYAEAIADEVTEDAALAPAIPTFPTVADPETRSFAAPGGKVPAWRKVFGRRPVAAVAPARIP